jgi:hypothetical protein
VNGLHYKWQAKVTEERDCDKENVGGEIEISWKIGELISKNHQERSLRNSIRTVRCKFVSVPMHINTYKQHSIEIKDYEQ